MALLIENSLEITVSICSGVSTPMAPPNASPASEAPSPAQVAFPMKLESTMRPIDGLFTAHIPMAPPAASPPSPSLDEPPVAEFQRNWLSLERGRSTHNETGVKTMLPS